MFGQIRGWCCISISKAMHNKETCFACYTIFLIDTSQNSSKFQSTCNSFFQYWRIWLALEWTKFAVPNLPIASYESACVNSARSEIAWASSERTVMRAKSRGLWLNCALRTILGGKTCSEYVHVGLPCYSI